MIESGQDMDADAAGVSEDPTLRETLAAAMADSVDSAPERAAAEPPLQRDGARAGQGRFARAGEGDDDPPARTTTTTEPRTPGSQDEPSAGDRPARTIAPPPSWSAAAKADFEGLPEHIQKEVLKREADIERGKAQWDQKASRLNRLDAVLQPRSERFRLSGIDEAHALQALFAAQDYLERDPVGGLSYLARQYGVDPRALAPPGGGRQPQPGAQPSPHLAVLAQEVQTLKGALAQQQRRDEQAQRSGHLNQVRAFASDPANLYFENVRERMGALLKAGTAKDLPEAYQQATWADPEIRQVLLRQQETQRRAEAQDAARAKAAQARHASGSVIGSPAPGSTPGRAGPAPTLRDELLNAWSQHAA
jgi:hypothetical protein